MTAIIKDRIAALVGAALEAAQRAGDLPAVALPEVTIDRPKIAEHGDYASNVAMRLQRATGGKPLDIAATVVKHLPARRASHRPASSTSGWTRTGCGSRWPRS